MDYDHYDAVLHYIWTRTQGDTWFKPSEEAVSAGVCLRISPDQFRVFPYENPFLAPFESAVRDLNPLCAVKVRSAAVHAALSTVDDTAEFLLIAADTRIQVLENINHLSKADKEQCGAFLRDERVLIVWSDDLDGIVPLCRDFESKVMKLVWGKRRTIGSSSILGSSAATSTAASAQGSSISLPVKQQQTADQTAAAALEVLQEHQKKAEVSQPPRQEKKWWNWWKLSSAPPPPADDVEKGHTPSPRPVRYFGPIYAGLAAALSIYFMLYGISIVLIEYRLDGNAVRFALLACAPFLLCIALFFSHQIIVTLSYVLGPVTQFHENSKYYSAVKPAPNPEIDERLPHVTIELPVYKESLEETITPSVYSIKKAMQSYARQGGTSAIFVHDDGLQLISEKEREKRKQFYADHNIGWVARPPHDNAADGFKRAGRFKKASNMNYGLALSLRMESKLSLLEAQEKTGFIMHDEFKGKSLEDRALEMAIEELYNENGKKWMPWASNAKSLRIGEIILIVDSDTVVPEDCFRDAARELYECPEVAIIQHESDVLQVAKHYFENGITDFTRRINKSISMGCANGEVAPFVGHNAFLRWSAIQDASFVDTDGLTKAWSENNVSEDFDIALRLQLKGYTIRWSTYSKGGFQEGVSLTVDDELNRWQKYAYGCNELIFNPFKDWWRLGPINKQLRVFLWSGAPVHYKLSMLGYMFSYYGIAASATLAVVNYFVLGWMLNVDGYYMHSFEIWLACLVVFPGLGNIGYTLLEYRLGHRGLFGAFLENIKWIPFFFFFFGGLSFHLITAILAHMFSYNITWGATAKEVERSNFFVEIPKIWKRFWPVFLIGTTFLAGIVVLAFPIAPLGWQIPIDDWGVIVPLALVCVQHMIFPIVLNPWLMVFSF